MAGFNRFLSYQVIIYTEEFALRLLESDVQIAEEEPSVEYRLYALMSRIISDLCLVAHPKQEESNGEEHPIVLQAHNQAYFGYTIETKNPITAMIFHAQSRTLTPVFWLEGKALFSHLTEPIRAWRADLEWWRNRASSIFESAVDQVREQAHFAFKSFKGDEYHVIILVGIFWSLLTFSRDKKERMRKLERESLDFNTPAENRGIKRRRDSSQERSEMTDLEKILHDFDANLQPESGFIIPNLPLPELQYFNESLVLGNPVKAINPIFLSFLAEVMDKQGFNLQPSWMTVPPGFDVATADKQSLKQGTEILGRVYSAKLFAHRTARREQRAADSYSPPSAEGDSDFVPPHGNDATPPFRRNKPIRTGGILDDPGSPTPSHPGPFHDIRGEIGQ
ncbi:hypothetical protein GYMLUDRAFT_244590 [Collybiopsis luxurians FD-317 M1]|uniref:Uncharacterized protein n=1 Tax=Collybiopsis luxurians FD-317 M1 TaxID=944289 RepID=A0A0D0BWX9_9AGAR|nr:hypothetical protein GYMLUDRAFT_244590 [Collybiopsis luxurians FD-317 M1]